MNGNGVLFDPPDYNAAITYSGSQRASVPDSPATAVQGTAGALLGSDALTMLCLARKIFIIVRNCIPKRFPRFRDRVPGP